MTVRPQTSKTRWPFRVCRVKPELHLFQNSWKYLTGFLSTYRQLGIKRTFVGVRRRTSKPSKVGVGKKLRFPPVSRYISESDRSNMRRYRTKHLSDVTAEGGLPQFEWIKLHITENRVICRVTVITQFLVSSVQQRRCMTNRSWGTFDQSCRSFFLKKPRIFRL